MTFRSLIQCVGAALLAASVPLALPQQAASAAPCSDVEVVFARGTVEPLPPLGLTGAQFVEALRVQAVGRSVGSYAVNYAASADFGQPLVLAGQVVDGIRDTQARLQSIVATCPGTKIVLGGYSQGAVVAGFATMAGVPDGVAPEYVAAIPPPLPPEIADNVVAVVFFGRPSDRFMRDVGAPTVTVGPQYTSKVLDYCIPGDTICDGSPVGQPNPLHVLYGVSGMAFNAAAVVAGRL